jgi:hypothetical protein
LPLLLGSYTAGVIEASGDDTTLCRLSRLSGSPTWRSPSLDLVGAPSAQSSDQFHV